MNPVASGTVIASDWANTTLDDLAFAMTDSLSRTGNGGMLTALPFIDGSAGNPSITFVNNLTTGRYLFAPGDMRDAVSGVDVLRYNNGTVTVWNDPNWVSIFQNAAEVSYDNSSSGLAATDVQAAIDEMDSTVDGLGTDKVDKAGDTMTGELIVDVPTTSEAGVSIRNNEGGMLCSTDNGVALLSVTQADGSNPRLGIGVDSGGELVLFFDGVLQAETLVNGGQLHNVWVGETAAPGTDTTQLATTAFVQAATAGMISHNFNANGDYIRWQGSGSRIQAQWNHRAGETTHVVALPVSYSSNVSYAVSVTQTGNNTSGYHIINKTASAFTVVLGSNDSIDWSTIGY